MTDSLTGGLTFGPNDRVSLHWYGKHWVAYYTEVDQRGRAVRLGRKAGIAGESSGECVRNAVQAAQLNEAPK